MLCWLCKCLRVWVRCLGLIGPSRQLIVVVLKVRSVQCLKVAMKTIVGLLVVTDVVILTLSILGTRMLSSSVLGCRCPMVLSVLTLLLVLLVMMTLGTLFSS